MALVTVTQILTKLVRGQSKLLCQTICKLNCSRPMSDCGFGQPNSFNHVLVTIYE
jgi:hypothetical protein